MNEKTKQKVDTMLEFMKLPNGAPLVPVDMLEWLITKGFFSAPASTKYHGAYEGGLFDHSLSVARYLVSLTNDLGLCWQDERSPYIVGMFHDLCKIDQYRHPVMEGVSYLMSNEPIFDESRWEYNPKTMLKGHGEKSVMLMAQFFTMTEEEIACVRYHMGAFTPKEEWNDYTGAIHTYSNVLWTHQADMLASHVEGV